MRNIARFKFHAVEEPPKPDLEEQEADNGILIHPPLLPFTLTPLETHTITGRVLK